MQADGICCLTKELYRLCGALSESAATSERRSLCGCHEREKKLKTKRLVADAMLVAVYFVLSNYLAVNLGGIRITLDVLPVLVAALMFGPLDGFIVGFVGNFLFQLAGPYGISITTALWALPDGIRGLLGGLVLKKRWSEMSRPRLMTALIIIALIFTSLTTGVMYVDCLVFKYSFIAYSPYILIRYVTGVIIAVLMTFVLPPLLSALDKTMKSGGANENNGD